MKKYIAVLLVTLIIGVTPAIAAEYSEITQTADLAVKGKGADVAAASELVEAVESRQATGAENETLTANVSSTESATVENNDSVTTSTNDQATESVDVQLLDEGLDSVTSANEDTQDLYYSPENDTLAENETIPINTTGIVMQSTDYSCGPAALATVLQNMGINTTEGELKVLAGTDTSGTTMHGLSEAAKAKGVNATGMRLSVDELKRNHIVHIILDGEGHYSVVRDVSSESVYLADPSLGNIVLSREEFSAIFTGNVLVISDPNNSTQVNQTETTNQTGIVQAENQTLVSEEMESIKGQLTVTNPENSQILTSEMMESIRGRWWEEVSKWGRWAADWVVDNARKLMPGPKGEFTYNASGNSTSNATGNYSSYQVGIKLTVSAKQTTKKRKIIRRR